MVSDQGQALEKYKLFDNSESRRKMKVKIKKEYILINLEPMMPFPLSL